MIIKFVVGYYLYGCVLVYVAACFTEETADLCYLRILHSCCSATYTFHSTHRSAVHWYLGAVVYAG